MVCVRLTTFILAVWTGCGEAFHVCSSFYPAVCLRPLVPFLLGVMTQSESPFTPCEGVRDEQGTDPALQHGSLLPALPQKQRAGNKLSRGRGQKMLAGGWARCHVAAAAVGLCRAAGCGEREGDLREPGMCRLWNAHSEEFWILI